MMFLTIRLSFLCLFLTLLVFVQALVHPMLRDGVSGSRPTRSRDGLGTSNGDRMKRGLPLAKPKRLYDHSELTCRCRHVP
jgi:hypothetical protein